MSDPWNRWTCVTFNETHGLLCTFPTHMDINPILCFLTISTNTISYLEVDDQVHSNNKSRAQRPNAVANEDFCLFVSMH